MKVKLKPPYELSEDEQLAVKMVRLNYHKTYEVISHNTFSYKIKRKGVELHAKKYLFNIIEEDMNPTKEQVLEAASTSKEAKNALVKLFPNYFKDDKYLDLRQQGNFRELHVIQKEKDSGAIPYIFYVNIGDRIMKNKSFCLSSEYNWEIVEGERGKLLLPIKKNV